jgi:hypothetical protein
VNSSNNLSIMNTRSAREYTMFAPEHLLRNWREQRPSNQSGRNSNVTGGWGAWESVLHGGGPASNFIFVPKYVIVAGLCFKWYTL